MKSDLVFKECPVCGDSIPFERVVFYKCGHKLCNDCSTAALKIKPECSICRDPILGQQPHRIYLAMDDLIHEKTIHVVEGLNKITVDTPATSVAKAGAKIQRSLENTGGDPEISEAILKAKKDLEDRIAPMFERLAEVKKENKRLLEQLQISEVNQQLQRDKVQKAKQLLLSERKECERQQQRAKDYMEMVKDRDAELLKLTAEQEQREKQLRLLKTKLKAVAKVGKSRRRPSQEQNTSLQIEGAPQDQPTSRLKQPSRDLMPQSDGGPESSTHCAKKRKQIVTS